MYYCFIPVRAFRRVRNTPWRSRAYTYSAFNSVTTTVSSANVDRRKKKKKKSTVFLIRYLRLERRKVEKKNENNRNVFGSTRESPVKTFKNHGRYCTDVAVAIKISREKINAGRSARLGPPSCTNIALKSLSQRHRPTFGNPCLYADLLSFFLYFFFHLETNERWRVDVLIKRLWRAIKALRNAFTRHVRYLQANVLHQHNTVLWTLSIFIIITIITFCVKREWLFFFFLLLRLCFNSLRNGYLWFWVVYNAVVQLSERGI